MWIYLNDNMKVIQQEVSHMIQHNLPNNITIDSWCLLSIFSPTGNSGFI